MTEMSMNDQHVEVEAAAPEEQSSPRPGTRACPVHFDHESAQHAQDWPTEFRDLRERCPMAWSGRHGGFWVASSYADIVTIAQNSELFTSTKSFNPETGEVRGGTQIPILPTPRGVPVESDPPEWDGFRTFLNRRLAPKAAEARRAKAEMFAVALLNRVIESGRIDLVDDLTNPLPALVTMDFFGFPLHEWQEFADPLHKMLFTPRTSPDFPKTVGALDWMHKRVREEIIRKRDEPGDDLLTAMATGEIDGKPLDDDTIWELSLNLLTGGVDTTTALTSNVLLYLHRNHAAREMLRNDRSTWPVAREEFLRFFSPIHGLGRNVSAQTELSGRTLLPGDRVYMAFSAGNRDPKVFNQPEEVDLTRFPNRHVAFGAGRHRCVGSFLARVMFETMLDAVLTRIPDYVIDESKAESYPSVAVVNGWIGLPATFTPNKKIDCALEL